MFNVAARVGILEVEHVEQVAESRHVVRNVGIGLVKLGIRQNVAAAAGKRAMTPIALDEFYQRSVVAIGMLDVAALGERRNGNERDAQTITEEVQHLNETAVVIAAAFIHGDENGGRGPLVRVALRQVNDVFCEDLWLRLRAQGK